jgi:hypothetical protein
VVGHNVPGLFRINGQQKTIAALKKHFLTHMYPPHSSSDDSDVEVTIRLAALPAPSTLPYNIHDVAGTFKLFLGDLRGGILGSMDVFESLRKALVPVKFKEDDLDFQCRGLDEEFTASNAKWVAKVLCSVCCSQQRNLIFAVFGLLAQLRQDRVSYGKFDKMVPLFDLPLALQDHCALAQSTTEQMSSSALGVIFAPLLLGNMSDQIRIDTGVRSFTGLHQRNHLSIPKKHSKPPSMHLFHFKRQSLGAAIIPVTVLEPYMQHRKSSSDAKRKPLFLGCKRICGSKKRIEECVELNEGVERNRVACRMVELLVRNWEGVVKAMRDVGYARVDGMRIGKANANGMARLSWK